MIKNPEKQYKTLQEANQGALSYDNLISYTENKHGWTIPKEEVTPEPKEKPSEFVQRTLEKKGHGCIKVWTGTDIKKPSQFVLKLRFNCELKSSECKQVYCERTTTLSVDKKTLTLTQETIVSTLKKLGIAHYGTKKPIPILQALQQEHQRHTTLGFFDTLEKEKQDKPISQKSTPIKPSSS